MSARYPIVTLCGSMRYAELMMQHAADMTRGGWIVIAPFVGDYVGGKDTTAEKQMLDDMHQHKIHMSDVVHVIGTHIGESTTREIEYATAIGVPIWYYNELLNQYIPEAKK